MYVVNPVNVRYKSTNYNLGVTTYYLYIIEKKFQATDGSVDEKLATFHFKCQEYEKLVRPLGLAVHFIYVLSEWYNQSKYNDYFSYMEQLGCEHYFAQLPLTAIGL